MRWHIQGTDSVSGRDVELTVHEEEATRAVQSAMDRQIVVSAVRPMGAGKARWLVPLTLALALVIALGGVGVGLYLENGTLRGKLDQALAEQRRMAASVEQAQRTADSIRAGGNLAQAAATQVAQLADELAAARSRMSLTERQLSAAHEQLSDLELAAQKVPGLEAQLVSAHEKLDTAQKQLQDSRQLAEQLRADLNMQNLLLAQVQNAQPPVDPAVGQVAELQKANGNLAAEIERLKAELLQVAARPADPPAPAPVPAPPAPNRWALRISYEEAYAFLVLHSDSNAIAAAPAGGGEALITSTGLLAANAVRMSFVHDASRERVYGATLAASLAADAPPDKLAENRALIAEFLRTFAPDFKDADAAIAATAQLVGQDASRRMVFLGADGKVTLWNDKTGVYTFQVDSSHQD
jgi:hypothetical protein